MFFAGQRAELISVCTILLRILRCLGSVLQLPCIGYSSTLRYEWCVFRMMFILQMTLAGRLDILDKLDVTEYALDSTSDYCGDVRSTYNFEPQNA